jgi:hypothetical protein
MFNCSGKNNKFNAVSIQGSYSDGSSNDIAGIAFKNYDNDSQRIYDMANITMRDDSSNHDFDGYGALILSTKAGDSNLMKEALRVKYNQFIGIGTSNPEQKLSIKDGNILVSGCNIGISIKNMSNVEIGMYSYSNSSNGIFYNSSNLIIGKIIEGSLQNPIRMRQDMSIDTNGNINLNSNLSIKGNLNVLSNVIFNSNLTYG